MSKFTCIYYQTDAGRRPVEEFIDSLHERTQQKYFEVVGLLEDYGKSLPKPHADFLGGEIYELRFVGIEGKVRILYFFYHGNKIIFTNGFVKKRQKAPKIEVELAKERRILYIGKHNG
ncbi:MAG: type II toxin-antitoxin system RelE/ParE family toxin [Candidatus Omnitrophota bacterium]|nr:type II toxin-antitoxin system RelE/ParE family toxin [Candidatus Omnitrophota bacterium]